MKTLTARTNEFSVIKELAHSGRLVNVKVVWSWRHLSWMWQFKYVPFVPYFFEGYCNGYKVYSMKLEDARNMNQSERSKLLGGRAEDLQNQNRY